MKKIISLGLLFFMVSCTKSNNMQTSKSFEPLKQDSIIHTLDFPIGSVHTKQTKYKFSNSKKGYEESDSNLSNPFENTVLYLKEGEQIYKNYCIYCHGKNGGSDGILVERGKYPPPPTFSKIFKKIGEGKMYHSITYGKNLMGAYSAQLTNEDRWKVILYIKSKEFISKNVLPDLATIK